jgi:hypothetical protein
MKSKLMPAIAVAVASAIVTELTNALLDRRKVSRRDAEIIRIIVKAATAIGVTILFDSARDTEVNNQQG